MNFDEKSPMTDHERGVAEGLRMAAEVCKRKWDDATRIAADANKENSSDGWEIAEQSCIYAAQTASEECAEEILSLIPEGADQRGAAASSADGSAQSARLSSAGSSIAEPRVTEVAGSIPASQSAPHQNPGEQVPDSARIGTDTNAVAPPAHPGPFVMVPREPTEKMLAAVREVVDEIPPYFGLTGNALNEQIWKAVDAMLHAAEEEAAMESERG